MTETKIMDIIPESLKEPLIQEVEAILQERSKKSQQSITPELKSFMANKKAEHERKKSYSTKK